MKRWFVLQGLFLGPKAPFLPEAWGCGELDGMSLEPVHVATAFERPTPSWKRLQAGSCCVFAGSAGHSNIFHLCSVH